MKNLCLLILSLLFYSASSQNLILNPNFEEGTGVTSHGDLDHATHWDHGCGVQPIGNNYIPSVSSDLYDSAVNGNTFGVCKFDVPKNRLFDNLPGKIGNRYGGFITDHGPATSGPPYNDYGESLLGTFSEPLGDCQYIFKMHLANAEGIRPGDCDNDIVNLSWDPNRLLQVALRKSGNCSLEKVVLTLPLGTSTNWELYQGSFSLSPADVQVGYDRFEVRRSLNSENVWLVADAFSLVADPAANDLALSISGGNDFCYGEALSFSGSDGPGTADVHMWEIVQSTSNGTPINGANVWNTWIAGSPGAFTFPSNLNLGCNKFFRIKLAAVNDCYGWTETTKVIRINCNPKIPKPSTITVCNGECITLAEKLTALNFHTYQWFDANGKPINNGGQIDLEICPQQPTTYTLQITNVLTGCSSQTTYTITVENNDPTWSHSQNTSNPNYYTIDAWGNNTSTNYGYAWEIRELDANMNTVCGAYNLPCWWVHPAATNFNGFNGNGCSTNCSSSSPGKFYYNKTYRITRGAWTKDCPWTQQSKIFFTSKPKSANSPATITVIEIEIPSIEEELRSNSSINTSIPSSELTAFPNPNDGSRINFNVESLLTKNGAATVELLTVSGARIHVEKLKYEASGFNGSIEFSNVLSPGVYIFKVQAAEEVLIQKIVVQ